MRMCFDVAKKSLFQAPNFGHKFNYQKIRNFQNSYGKNEVYLIMKNSSFIRAIAIFKN